MRTNIKRETDRNDIKRQTKTVAKTSQQTARQRKYVLANTK